MQEIYSILHSELLSTLSRYFAMTLKAGRHVKEEHEDSMKAAFQKCTRLTL